MPLFAQRLKFGVRSGFPTIAPISSALNDSINMISRLNFFLLKQVSFLLLEKRVISEHKVGLDLWISKNSLLLVVSLLFSFTMCFSHIGLQKCHFEICVSHIGIERCHFTTCCLTLFMIQSSMYTIFYQHLSFWTCF